MGPIQVQGSVGVDFRVASADQRFTDLASVVPFAEQSRDFISRGMLSRLLSATSERRREVGHPCGEQTEASDEYRGAARDGHRALGEPARKGFSYRELVAESEGRNERCSATRDYEQEKTKEENGPADIR
jgi:hypothetical protein